MLKYRDLVQFIEGEVLKGTDNSEIYKQAIEGGYQSSFDSFKRYVRYIKKRHGMIENNYVEVLDEDKKIIKILETNKAMKISSLMKSLKCNKTDLQKLINKFRKMGYEITLDNDVVYLSTSVVGREPENITQLSNCNEIIFGVVSDTHFGSKSCQITALNEFSEIMRHKGVKHIFTPGDLVAGFDVYPGQVHDLYALSAKDQEDSTLLNLPIGFDWYILGGNHDYSFIKRGGGYNIIDVIASKRRDIHYIGFDEANVPILNNVDVKLTHPSGGVPYSISYRLQKNIEQITISELQSLVRGVKVQPTVRFVLAGHLHIQMQAMFGSIWGAQCGTFEGQTNYLKRKGLVPCIGGWIVKATLGGNGMLKNFDAKFYMFDEIEDDWKNYKHTIQDKKITKPIFEK